MKLETRQPVGSVEAVEMREGYSANTRRTKVRGSLWYWTTKEDTKKNSIGVNSTFGEELYSGICLFPNPLYNREWTHIQRILSFSSTVRASICQLGIGSIILKEGRSLRKCPCQVDV